MRPGGRFLGLAVVASMLLSGGFSGTASAATTVLRLDGVGPLKLGMKRSEALATGWLSAARHGLRVGRAATSSTVLPPGDAAAPPTFVRRELSEAPGLPSRRRRLPEQHGRLVSQALDAVGLDDEDLLERCRTEARSPPPTYA
jgi:hypothetical protein